MNSPQHIYPDILYAIRLLEEDKELNGDKAVSIIETTIANYDNSRYPDFNRLIRNRLWGSISNQLRICQMNKRELSDEIKTWMWIK